MSIIEQETKDLRERVLNFAKDTDYPRCEKMQWSMDRFLTDVEDAENGDSPYYMDWKELALFNRWASMFKHTKGVLAGQSIELHISQLWESANIFCFKRKSDNTRRFREVYIQKARKNAE